MTDPDSPAPSPRPMPVSHRVLIVLLVVFVGTGFVTLVLTGQNHHSEAKLACERFVKRRLPATAVRFSGEKVRDLSSIRHVVAGTVSLAGRAPMPYTCTVSH